MKECNCFCILQTSALHNKDTEKDKNDMDLTKAEDIKNWQEHTVNYTKEILMFFFLAYFTL